MVVFCSPEARTNDQEIVNSRRILILRGLQDKENHEETLPFRFSEIGQELEAGQVILSRQPTIAERSENFAPCAFR